MKDKARNSRVTKLCGSQSDRAYALWKSGYDTYEIASQLHVTEASVYNGLREYRERLRKEAA